MGKKIRGKEQGIQDGELAAAEMQNSQEPQLAGGGVGSKEGEGVLGPTQLLPLEFNYLPWRRKAPPLWQQHFFSIPGGSFISSWMPARVLHVPWATSTCMVSAFHRPCTQVRPQYSKHNAERQSGEVVRGVNKIPTK